MKTEALILEGTKGLVQGERFAVGYGRTAVIGRSRECDLCLCSLPKHRAMTPAERAKDKPFLGISRQHVRVRCFNSGFVEFENLGRHGSLVDGEPLVRKVLTDLRDRTHTLRLGTRETLELRWGTIEEHETQTLGRPLT